MAGLIIAAVLVYRVIRSPLTVLLLVALVAAMVLWSVKWACGSSNGSGRRRG